MKEPDGGAALIFDYEYDFLAEPEEMTALSQVHSGIIICFLNSTITGICAWMDILNSLHSELFRDITGMVT